jgi:hypothetical protein
MQKDYASQEEADSEINRFVAQHRSAEALM